MTLKYNLIFRYLVTACTCQNKAIYLHFLTLNFFATTPDEIEVLNKFANGTDTTFLMILRIFTQGRSQDFSKGGSHCVKVRVLTSSPDCHYDQGIVMAFSPPPVVGFLVKKGLQKGGSRAPQDPPLATPLFTGMPYEATDLPGFKFEI